MADIGKVFYSFACLEVETESRSINTQEKNLQIPAILTWTSSVDKGFIIWKKTLLSLGRTEGNPKPVR